MTTFSPEQTGASATGNPFVTAPPQPPLPPAHFLPAQALPLQQPLQQPVQQPAPLPHHDLPPPIRFGLCGATGGGKTTFLASLSIAIQSAEQHGLGQWTMTAADEPSLRFVVERERELVHGRRFPHTTTTQTQFRWQIDGQMADGAGRRGARLLRQRKPTIVSFSLDVEDRPGGQFLLDSGIPMTEEGLDRLAASHALIFLFDPLRELGRTETELPNWLYFQKLLQTLKMRLLRRNGLVHGRLPHFLAVCVTKFDDPNIFIPAYHDRLIDIDADGLPRVPNHRAEEFFDWICGRIEQQAIDAGTAQLRDLIRSTFIEDRVRYFCSSSVGFYVGASGEVDLNDFQNFDLVNGEWRIRGKVRPVNVLEPLVAIERRVRSGAWE